MATRLAAEHDMSDGRGSPSAGKFTGSGKKAKDTRILTIDHDISVNTGNSLNRY